MTARERSLVVERDELHALVIELDAELRATQLKLVRVLIAAAERHELIAFAEQAIQRRWAISPHEGRLRRAA